MTTGPTADRTGGTVSQFVDSSDQGHATTDHTDIRWYLGDAFNYTVGGIDLWLGLQAIIMNLLVISFYCKTCKKIVPFMYLMMAVCDLVTGVAALLVALVFLLLKTHPDVSVTLAFVAYPMFSITFKVSVFLNLSIAIIRTINICLPFYRMRITEVAIATAVYTLGWAIFSGWNLMSWEHHVSIVKNKIYYAGQYQAVYGSGHSGADECISIVLFIGIPYVLPSLAVVFCMMVQIKAIMKTAITKTGNTATQRKITITILMLTVLFFLCNTVYIYWPISQCSEVFSQSEDDEPAPFDRASENVKMMIAHVTGVMCPFLNAAFNPVILIVRGEALVSFLRRKLQRFSTLHTNQTRLSVMSLSIKNPNTSKTDYKGPTTQL